MREFVSILGTIAKLDAMLIAKASWRLGAGRSKPDEAIDYKVGIRILRKIGDSVTKGDGILEVHRNTTKLDEEIVQQLQDSITITQDEVPPEPSLIIEVLTKDDVEQLPVAEW